MFQSVDSPDSPKNDERQRWAHLLARAPIGLLEAGLGAYAQASPDWLRNPETGLMMVQGRAGGSGERFNLGEVTVTRCALRLGAGAEQTPVGVAYVLGRSQRKARLVAIADALLQVKSAREQLSTALLEPIAAWLARNQTERAQRAQTTKVDFFTVAREATGLNAAEED